MDSYLMTSLPFCWAHISGICSVSEVPISSDYGSMYIYYGNMNAHQLAFYLFVVLSFLRLIVYISLTLTVSQSSRELSC